MNSENMFFNGIWKGLFMNFFSTQKICCAKTLRRSQKTFRRPQNHFSTRFNVYWSNKKFWMKKLFGVPRTKFLKKFQIFGRFSMTHVGSDFSLNRAKFIWIRKMFVFRNLTSFLSEIFVIRQKIPYIIWKYMISRHYSSWLLVFSSFSTAFLLLRYHQEDEQQGRAMTTNDEKIYIFTKYNIFSIE